jgi:hypothetical protein
VDIVVSGGRENDRWCCDAVMLVGVVVDVVWMCSTDALNKKYALS